MNTLILTVGLPRCGKSTWALKQNHPIVNPDSVRLALHGNAYIADAEPMVWVMSKYMVKSLFITGHETVIVDATNVTQERRAFWKSDDWNVLFTVMPDATNAALCLKRAMLIEDANRRDGLINAIHRMQKAFEWPTSEEGPVMHAST